MRILTLLLAAVIAGSPAPAAHSAARGTASRTSALVQPSAQDEFDAGQRHYARGEYRQAADAFGRAAARLEPVRKPEARYWAGLSWLGASDAVQARSAFEDVIATPSPRHALAQLGLAQSWELAGRGDRAYSTLETLTGSGDLGEAAGTALGRFIVLARARGDDDAVRRARERLLREAPSSMEAAAEHLESTAPAGPAAATEVVVQIGAFSEIGKARALADVARRAGFERVTVVERTERGESTWRVWIGSFDRPADARRVAARASERLGLAARIVSP